MYLQHLGATSIVRLTYPTRAAEATHFGILLSTSALNVLIRVYSSHFHHCQEVRGCLSGVESVVMVTCWLLVGLEIGKQDLDK